MARNAPTLQRPAGCGGRLNVPPPAAQTRAVLHCGSILIPARRRRIAGSTFTESEQNCCCMIVWTRGLLRHPSFSVSLLYPSHCLRNNRLHMLHSSSPAPPSCTMTTDLHKHTYLQLVASRLRWPSLCATSRAAQTTDDPELVSTWSASWVPFFWSMPAAIIDGRRRWMFPWTSSRRYFADVRGVALR